MPINSRELLSVLSQLTQDRHVRNTFTGSLKGGLITGTAATLGGIVLGPFGLIVGGLVGGLSSYLMSKETFKPISEVIMYDMTDAQRTQLLASVSAVIAELRVDDIALLLPLLLNNPGAREAVLRSVFAFIQNEMQLEIMA